MSGTITQTILTTLIVAILTRVPVPQVHSHSSMDSVQLASHLAAMHSGQLASELPSGWHVHLFFLGPIGSSDPEDGFPGDPKNRQNTTDHFTFHETELEIETMSKIAVRDTAFSQTLSLGSLAIQAELASTKKNTPDRSRGFAESGQWGYAPTVLLI